MKDLLLSYTWFLSTNLRPIKCTLFCRSFLFLDLWCIKSTLQKCVQRMGYDLDRWKKRKAQLRWECACLESIKEFVVILEWYLFYRLNLFFNRSCQHRNIVWVLYEIFFWLFHVSIQWILKQFSDTFIFGDENQCHEQNDQKSRSCWRSSLMKFSLEMSVFRTFENVLRR